MDKKVLILSASPRKGGNSETLCAEFTRGVSVRRKQALQVHRKQPISVQ